MSTASAKALSPVLARAALAAAMCAALACAGCAQAPAPTSDDETGGAEQSFTDEALESHDGSPFYTGTYSFDELMDEYDLERGSATDDGFAQGAYLVGAGETLEPGTYLFQGSQSEMGSFYVYAPQDGEEGLYSMKYPFAYFGWALAELSAGDAVFFKPAAETDLITAVPEGPIDPRIPLETPCTSGMYRVGIDIPAGTYAVTQEEASAEALSARASLAPSVVIYDSLDLSRASEGIEEELPRLDDGGENGEEVIVHVEDGQILELFGCTALLMEA